MERLEERLMLSATPADYERLVNDLVIRHQGTWDTASSIAISDANLVVAFAGKGPTDPQGVFAKLYDDQGTQLLATFQVNTTRNEAQHSPVVAADPAGNFVVAWAGRGAGDQSGVFFQRFNAQGQPLGGETLVNTTTGGVQDHPAIAMAPSGEFILAWQGVGAGDAAGVFQRRFNAAGAAQGPETLVNQTTHDQQAFPSVAIAADGSSVVSWSSRHQDGSDWAVLARTFNTAGDALTDEFFVNATTAQSQLRSRVVFEPSGNFWVSWSSYGQDGDGWGTYARQFSSSGDPLGSEQRINSATEGHQKDISLAVSRSGNLVATYASGVPDGGGWELYAQPLTSTGSGDGDAVRVHEQLGGYASGHQQFAAAAFTSANALAVVYSGNGLSDHGGVYLTSLASAATVALAPIEDQTIDELTTLAVQASATTTGGAAVTYSLERAPEGAAIDPATGAISWTPTEAQGPGVFPFTVVAALSPTQRAKEVFIVTVREVNQPPVLAPIGNRSTPEEQLLTFTVSATDADLPAQRLVFRLGDGAPTGATIDPLTGVFRWTPTEAQGPGDYPVTVIVTDLGSPEGIAQETITITVGEVNRPPVLSEIADLSIPVDGTLVVALTATDPDIPANALTYRADQLPDGATLDTATGVVRWTPTEAQANQTFPFTITVLDNGTPQLSDTISFQVTVVGVNDPPSLSPLADVTVDEQTLFTVTAVATDPNNDTLTYALDDAPAGATIDPQTGVITWTPTEAQGPGSHVFTVVVIDSGTPALSDTTVFVVTVREVNLPPVIAPIGDRAIDEQTTLSLAVIATDPDLPANFLTYALPADANPAGATIHPETGVITWTPTEAQGPGVYAFRVEVADNGDPPLTAFAEFNITVREVNLPPLLSDVAPQQIDPGQELVVIYTATDPDLPPNNLTFSIEGDARGATIVPGSAPRTAEFRWTPASDLPPGEYSFSIVVTDNATPALSDTSTLVVTVRSIANQPPSFTKGPDQTVHENSGLHAVAAWATEISPGPAGEADQSLTFLVTTDHPEYFEVAPAIAPNGTLTYTPAINAVGTALVTVRLQDNGGTANGGVDTSPAQTFSIVIEPCAFDDHLTDWTVTQDGGTAAGQGTVTADDCEALLREGDSFVVTLAQTFVVPAGAASLSFEYAALNFDTTSTGLIKDAFEAALVDSTGASLVPTHASGPQVDAFFNVTEGVGMALGSGVTVVGNVVTVSLAGIAVGTHARLLFRLANNDTDDNTSVRIVDVALPAGATLPAQNSTAKFFVVDAQAEAVFRYGVTGTTQGDFTTHAASLALRGIASSAAGDVLWTIDGASHTVAIYGPGGARLGAWQAAGLDSPEGITVWQDDVWIVDRALDQVLLFSGAASRRTGTIEPTSSFALAAGNTNPSDLVTDGTTIWVTDDAADKVFVYTVAGDLVGSWALDAANSDASGITLDPTGAASDLWTVDRVDGLVYRYADARGRLDGSQNAADTFTLVAGNIGPEGIADPPVREPTINTIGAQIEWAKYEFLLLPNSREIISTPAVIDVNGDSVPDIIFTAYTGGESTLTTGATIRALDGRTGDELWAVSSSPVPIDGASQVAVGDIDLDGSVEIIVLGSPNRVLAFEHDGTFKWVSPAIPGASQLTAGGATLADLDGDGTPEIVIGATVLNAADGSIRWTADRQLGNGIGTNSQGPLSIVADIDRDGIPEVIAGKSVFRADGTFLWNARTPQGTLISDGFPAIANLDDDAFPEIVLVANGKVYVIDHDGVAKNEGVAIRGGGRGGAPTVADFDGDGEPEIGVAGGRFYVVFETDGTERWYSPTQDQSSNVTGSSVFDLDGDGTAEILYADELFFRIYQTTSSNDLETIYELPKSSGTSQEYPIVADVDGDGSAEIVLVANTRGNFGPDQGIIVIGGPDNHPWQATRPIWNQHSYHITNVNDDGTIPRVELNSWELYNNYRRNQQITGTAIFPPTISASAPTASSAVGSTVVLTGRGAANGKLPTGSANRIVSVELNGTAVDVLDANGNFFAAVQVLPGENRYRFTAYDAVGQTVSTEVVVTGTQATAAVDFSRYADITGSFSGVYGRTSFKEEGDLLLVELATRNDGAFATDVPLLVGVKNLRTRGGGLPTVSLVGADGVLPDGTPYFDFSQYVADRRLGPGQATDSPVITFHNPGRERFDYDLVFYGRLNQAPVITSVPDVEALIGKPYTYPVTATDEDGDALTYRLLEAPAGMAIAAATGLITWTPTAAQQGNHTVVVQADDHRGGTAEQRYTLSVIPAPPNRPPVITSVPVTIAKVAEILGENEELVDLSTWEAFTFVGTEGNGVGTSVPGNWIVDASRTFVEQRNNADASVFLSDFEVDRQTIRGSFRVNDTGLAGFVDNDFIGFVFAHQSENQFYLFDWRSASENSQGSIGLRGMSVKVVDIEAPYTTRDFWHTNGNGDRVQTLYHNDIGWKNFTDYRFQLDFVSGSFVIKVWELLHDGREALLADFALADDTYASGKFGFYNYSQGQVQYRGFTRTAQTSQTYRYQVEAIDPDHDALTYALTTNPDGMAINAQTGLISWGPTAEQVGNHRVVVEVTDGRGGIATQEFIVCVEDPNGTMETLHVVDLVVEAVDTSAVVYDAQLLLVSGKIAATIVNRGPNSTPAAFTVSFFEDRNHDRQYDPTVDVLLGSTNVRRQLDSREIVSVEALLSGFVQFAGSPIYAFVDSTNAIDETDETNNTGRDLHEFIPTPGSFNPVVEWSKSTFSVLPSSNQVMMTPAVIDLNGDGIPDIVFSTFTGTTPSNANSSDGRLRAISGDDGRELWTVTDSQYRVLGTAGLAVADIDGDGLAEIVAVYTTQDRLIAFEHDGTFKWLSPTIWGGVVVGGPALADLDGDGTVEIIIGGTALNANGSIRWQGNAAGGLGRGDNGGGPLSFAADLDLDGALEVVAGRSAYRADGSLYWNAPINDGFPAIGNFDDDDYPEIVVVANGQVYILEHDGQIKRGPVAIPGGGRGGAPTIADFDGDGLPEIGVAGATRYVVFERDLTVKWSVPIQDATSHVTGSSVFDFEGDGKVEVLYADELALRIYRGEDGAVLYTFPRGSSTAYEMPLIVDVDGDGNAEIVVIANTYRFNVQGRTGIYVIGDLNDSWVPTRQIWNQHAYSVTNINDDGTIPAYPEPSWLAHNSFRLNVLPEAASARLAPDLTASWLRVEPNGTDFQLTARIGNGGSIFSPTGVSIAFYNGDPAGGGTLLGTTKVGRLEPGRFEDISIIVPADGTTDVWIVADDDGTGRGTVSESNELNNVLHAGLALQPINQPPIITSTPASGAIEGQLYTYLVVAEDHDGDLPIAYNLHIAPTGMQVEPTTGAISWVPGAGDAGVHPVQVLATDAWGGRAIQVFSLLVAGALNSRPAITSDPLHTTTLGEFYRYEVVATDAEDDDLSYSLIVAPSGMRIYAEFGILEWTPLREQIGIHEVTIRVDDGQGGVDVQQFTLTVIAPNTAPLFTSVPATQAVQNRPFVYEIAVQDADGELITVSLEPGSVGTLVAEEVRGPNDEPLQTRYRLEWTPSADDVAAGSRTISLRATDARGASVVQTVAVNVVATAPNVAPQITSTPRIVARPGVQYGYAVIATDANADPLTYALDPAEHPAGMTISAAGVIRWTPPAGLFGEHPVRVLVSDGLATATQQFTITIASQADNRGPAIVSNPPQAGRHDKEYVYDAVAADPDGDPVAWSLDAAPIGMSIHRETGAIRWTPREDQIGTHQVVLRATDPLGASTVQSFTIEVNCANTPPLILSTPPTEAAVGETYFYGVRAIDPDGDRVALSLVSGPQGMTISPTGLIRWTPGAADNNESRPVVVRVDDGDGGFAMQQFEIVVSDATNLNRAPTITSTPVFSVTIGNIYDYLVTAVDSDGDTLTYRLLVSPDWMSIDPQTGAITGTPTAEGVESVVVEVSDGTAKTTQGFALNVRLNQAPTISSSPVTAAMVGGIYRYTVKAADPDGDPLTYALLPGAPAGMTIDGFGRIVWNVPSDFNAGLPAGQSRTADVKIRVSDPRGAAATQDFTIAVAPDAQAPQVVLQIQAGSRSFTGSAEIDLGATATIVVTAYDNVGVTSLVLEIDGQIVPLDAQGRATITAETLFDKQLVARARDAAGNEGTASGTLRVATSGSRNRPNVSDPTLPPHPGFAAGDTREPIVTITSPAFNASVTNLTPIIGTIDDPEDNLWYWRVYTARFDQLDLTQIDINDPDLKMIAQGTQEIHAGEIAKFDPSAFSNDPYAILVAAFDVNGRGYVAATVVTIEGNVKLGAFRLEFTDLSIPLAGIPISVTRVYDTHDASRQGDFGYGWTLGVKDARILEVGAIGDGGGFDPGANTFVPGKTKVYITNPAGQRVGFTYQERLTSGGFFGAVFEAYFVPDPGVYDKLTIDDPQVFRGGILGAFGEGINPDVYTLTTADGTRYRYNQHTGLQSITDLSGNVVTFTSAGIKHSSGVEVKFVRDNRGRITEIIDPAGNKLLYGYNAAGDLVSFTSQTQLTTTFKYHAAQAHYLDEIVDPLGRRAVKTEYDDQGRILRVIDAAGNVVEYDHSLEGFERIRDAAGNWTALKYDNYGNVVEERRGEHVVTLPSGGEQTAYDSIVRTQYIHERDGVKSPNRDKEWQVTQVYLDVLGNTVKEVTTEYDYDARGNVVKVTDVVGGQTLVREFAYDAKNNVTRVKDELGRQTLFTYDAKGNLREVVNAEGNKSLTAFDGQGRVTSYTDFNGNVTTFVYAGSQSQPSEIRNPGHTDAAPNARKFEYNAFGQTTKITDEEGIVTEYHYDNAGRLTYERIGADAPVRSIYQGQNLSRRIVARSEVESGASDIVTEYGYYDNDLLRFEIDALGAVTGYEYDANGNRTFLGRWNTKADYDADVAAKAASPATVFAGRYPRATFEHVFVYDRLNRLDYEIDDVQLALAEQGGIPLDQITVRLDYDYDSAGNRTEVVDRNGRKRTFEYDERNRMIAEFWWQFDVTSGQEEVIRSFTWQYCTCGNVSQATEYDGPVGTSPILSRYTYTYDTVGRLKSVDNAGTSDMPHVVLSYGYDANGNQIRVEDSLGVAVVSTYDAQNRLKTRAWENAPGIAAANAVDEVLVEFDYYRNGTQKELRRYDVDEVTGAKTLVGRTLHGNLDASGRVRTISHRDAVDQAIAEYTYGFDKLGLVKSLLYDNRDDQYDFDVTYDYDDLGQLVEADYSDATTARGIYQDEFYNYDKNGNRTSSHLHDDGYVTGPGNRLLSDGTFNYEYDNDGNQIRKTDIASGEVTVFEYDYRNRMTRATRYSQAPESGGIILAETTNRYDVDGRRIAFSTDDDGAGPNLPQETRVIHNGDDTWADFNSLDELSARYMLGSRIDQILAVSRNTGSSNGETNWYLTDHLGTVRDVLNNTGMLSSHVPYEAFGAVALSAANKLESRFSYMGREYQPLVNQYYYRSRQYDPYVARFNSEDDIRFDANDFNLFRFVNNSPFSATDPTGNSAVFAYSVITAKAIYAVTALAMVFQQDRYKNDKDYLKKIAFCPILYQYEFIALALLPWGNLIGLLWGVGSEGVTGCPSWYEVFGLKP